MTKSQPGDPGRIRIVTVDGSTQPEGYTGKALALAVDELERDGRVAVETLAIRDMRLSFPGETGDRENSSLLRERVKRATAVMLATPEYHGSFSSGLKLFIENLGFPSVLAGKPVALLGVAAGRIGAVKSLEHLRSVCSHVGAIVLPGPVSVAQVREKFAADGKCLDETIERQIRGAATAMMGYIHDNVCPRFALEQMVRQGLG